MKTEIEELKAAMQELADLRNVEGVNPLDMQHYMVLLARYTGYFAWASGLQLKYSYEIEEKKRKIYDTYKNESFPKSFTATVLKDYVNSMCSEENYNLGLCIECVKAHKTAIDGMRTILSTLKEEMKLSNSPFNN